jgi:hypothetical protein
MEMARAGSPCGGTKKTSLKTEDRILPNETSMTGAWPSPPMKMGATMVGIRGETAGLGNDGSS